MNSCISSFRGRAVNDCLPINAYRQISSAAIPSIHYPQTLRPRSRLWHSTKLQTDTRSTQEVPSNSLASHNVIPNKRTSRDIYSFRGNRSFSTKAVTMEPTIHHVFEDVTGTWQYIVADEDTKSAVIIDPVLDYEPATQSITTETADSLLAMVEEKGYRIERILETHAHADHLTAASYLQKQLASKQGFKPSIGIGKRIDQVQKLFGNRYGLPSDEYETVFDKLFEDDESFQIGSLNAKVIHLPGHTPDHLGYQIGDNVFCGDSLFHADIGTARCDFPGGDAKDLYKSGRKLLALDDHVKIWPGHDYPPDGRDSPVPWLSVADHRKQNKHVRDTISENEFVALRTERDAKLNAPRLLHQSLQVNIRAGQLPRSVNGKDRMLHLPLKLNGLEW